MELRKGNRKKKETIKQTKSERKKGREKKEEEREERVRNKKGRQKKKNLKDSLRKLRPRPRLVFYNNNRLRVRVSCKTHSSDCLRARVPV